MKAHYAFLPSTVYQFVVIYGSDGGSVVAGGWIHSPEGACLGFCEGARAKANFGFVSKYKKGAGGQYCEFNFMAGGLNFHSDICSWLVVTGSDYSRMEDWAHLALRATQVGFTGRAGLMEAGHERMCMSGQPRYQSAIVPTLNWAVFWCGRI